MALGALSGRATNTKDRRDESQRGMPHIITANCGLVRASYSASSASAITGFILAATLEAQIRLDLPEWRYRSFSRYVMRLQG